MEAPANKAAKAEGENSGESPEGQAQTNVNLEVNNTSPEENGGVLSERAASLRGGLRRHMGRFWRRIAMSSLPAKTGHNPGFHQNARSNIQSSRMPANHMVSVSEIMIIFSMICVTFVEFIITP